MPFFSGFCGMHRPVTGRVLGQHPLGERQAHRRLLPGLPVNAAAQGIGKMLVHVVDERPFWDRRTLCLKPGQGVVGAEVIVSTYLGIVTLQ